MRATVLVRPKEGILDPQGEAVQGSLQRLGFAVDTACDQQDCIVDTTRTGDGNGGHLWGTDLSESDRMALLEYLKTY